MKNINQLPSETLNPLSGLIKLFSLVSFLAMTMATLANAAPILDLATRPLSTLGVDTIKPNLLYMFDDSYSMHSTFMPDWVSLYYTNFYDDPSLNALAYNPAIRYNPPAYFTSEGLLDKTTYPSQTGDRRATGADISEAMPNWRAVTYQAYIPSSIPSLIIEENLVKGNLVKLNGDKAILEGSAKYTISVPNEFCDNVDLRNCQKATLPTLDYPYPAPLRWCKTQAVAEAEALPALGECQAVRSDQGQDPYSHFRFPVLPSVAQATIWLPPGIQLTGSESIAAVKVKGQHIMKGGTAKGGSRVQLLIKAKDEINGCMLLAEGNCKVSGYYAKAAQTTLTITSPNAADIGFRPQLITANGAIKHTATPFKRLTTPAPLARVTVNIEASNNSYPYPGSREKHIDRTDCVANTCTYKEEMTNYANWFAYYRSRALLMKTATSLAFADLGNDFRMGYLTINNHKPLDFKPFEKAHKKAWYDTLFSTTYEYATPLHAALSRAGRIYANKETLGTKAIDPIQYECQQNFTLLTTDGKWTDDTSNTVDGRTVPNMDGDPTEPGKYEGPIPSPNQLADVAKYYYDTDLRTPAGPDPTKDFDNCTGALGGDVCSTGGATGINVKQNMVTFTLGLGVDGTLAYSTDYGPNTPGDYKRIVDGDLHWPLAVSGFDTTIDDLWHAAVNGGGRYYSAKQSKQLVEQLREVIAKIKVKVGVGAAAATSNLNPVSGDNFAYIASYESGTWAGNLEKREIDIKGKRVKKAALACVEDIVTREDCVEPAKVLSIGKDGRGNDQFSCITENVTDQRSCKEGTLVGTECRVSLGVNCRGSLKKQATRTILMNHSGALEPFGFANFTQAQSANYNKTFLSRHLTQGPLLSADHLVNLTGANIINYIKGDKDFEENVGLIQNRLFRNRSTILGDVINSKPSFVGKPTFSYSDAGYQAYKKAQAARPGTVYVGSNDGMLHAFDSDTLKERWAFVPSAVIPNLWKLANTDYSAKHQYFVDGDVTVSDVCVASDCGKATASDWRTILIGGLNGGGRSYYAIDITNPVGTPNSALGPKLLWEIDPSDRGFGELGYTFGKPIVTKRQGDGKWVVVFTSGYNNIPHNNFKTGGGKGYLYIVDPSNGNLLDSIATLEGTTSSPSGLAEISAYTDDAEGNNITTFIYGGDLDGNVWRFNIASTSTGSTRVRLAELKDETGTPQPITTAPVLGDVGGHRVVFVGTGKYLEVKDLDPAGYSTQSIYAIRDTAVGAETTTVNPDPRSLKSGFVKQTLEVDTINSNRRISGPNNSIDLTLNRGWYIDFPDAGERQNVASQLVLGTLIIPTTVPTGSACQPAGYGWFSYLDFKTGLAVPAQGASSVSEKTLSPSAGFNIVYDGKPTVFNIGGSPDPIVMDVPFPFLGASSSTGFNGKRTIWREIIE